MIGPQLGYRYVQAEEQRRMRQNRQSATFQYGVARALETGRDFAGTRWVGQRCLPVFWTRSRIPVVRQAKP